MTVNRVREAETQRRRILRPVAAGLSLAAIFTAVVSIPLDAAGELGLSPDQTSAWILMTWGLPSVLTIILSLRYHQPLLITGNIFILIFVLLLGGELAWPELVGATMVAGAVVLLLGLTGLTHRLASVLPHRSSTGCSPELSLGFSPIRSPRSVLPRCWLGPRSPRTS